MKRTSILVLGLFTMLFLVGCGGAQKAVNEVKSTLKGEWTIQSVDVDSELDLTIKLLNDATTDCFEGSNWRFIANNNSGMYKLSGFDCANAERNFYYTVEKMNDGISGDILLKPVNADGESIGNNQGFRITVNYLDENTMTWTQYVNYGGRRVQIDMNFKSKKK